MSDKKIVAIVREFSGDPSRAAEEILRLRTQASNSIMYDAETRYYCEECDTVLDDGERRCDSCNKFASRVTGHECPKCNEFVSEDV